MTTYSKILNLVSGVARTIDLSNTSNVLGVANLELLGSTSGHLLQTASATTTSYTIVWPDSQGAASTFLQNDGSGNLSWSPISSSPAISNTFVAGQSFSANTSYVVRWGMNALSETTNRVYAADYDTSSYDEFWALGIAMSTSGVTAGQNIQVYSFGTYTLGSSDTPFNTVNIGAPVWLTSAGAFSVTAPTGTSEADLKIGIIMSTTSIWLDGQVTGIGNANGGVPIYPLEVAAGGTGLNSLTPYAVICGGTGSTTAMQQVSGLGTSGYVLTSNGASALPTWQPGGTSLTFSDSLVNNSGTVTLVNDSASPGNSKYYGTNSGGTLGYYSIPANGVTSVALADGSSTPIYSISGSPVTSTGTLTFTLDTQSANTVFAGPNSGSAAQPTFRSLVSADIPNNAANTTGTSTNITATSNSTLTTLSALSLPTSQLSGDISLTSQVSGILPIANGGTNVSSVTTSPTSTAFAGWDSNKNLSANNFINGYTSTATAAGTTTLTVSSTCQQYFTGTTTQTVILPVTSTLVLGQSFIIVNNSTGVITVESSGANTVLAQAPNSTAVYTCTLTSGTTAASWNVSLLGGGGAYTPTTTIYTSGSGTFTTPANASFITVKMVGGGGGGAGGAQGNVTGGGGGSGGYIELQINSPTSSYSYSVGGGGAGGGSSTGGSSGGNTVFNSITAGGGGGGGVGGEGQNGGTATGGTINIPGGGGGPSSTGGSSWSPAGAGGSCPLGAGGSGASSPSSGENGGAGTGYGSGGGGGSATSSAVGSGGNGASGIIIITAYYNNGAVGTATGITGSVNSSQVLGTTAGGNATAGYVGEFISANPGSGVAIGSTGAFVTITSISLTAGDWDVEGTASLVTGSTTAGTVFSGGISLNATSEDSQANGGVFDSFNTLVASSTYLSPTGKRRINISTTTTVYLVGAATYSVAGGATWGTNSFIGARRVR